jgi:hypothetical protein
MKIDKWALHHQVPVVESFEIFRAAFQSSNSLMYSEDYDNALRELWNIPCTVYSKLIHANMQRWLPADFYFHFSSMSAVWFFSLHLKQPALSDIDMLCNRYMLPLKRGIIRPEPNVISVSAYLTGVTPSDEKLLKNIFIGCRVECNEISSDLD